MFIFSRQLYLCFNIIMPNCQQYFNHFFRKNNTLHGHRTRQSDHLHFPIYKNRIGNQFITKQGVIIWNKVIEDGLDGESLGALKQITQIIITMKY